MAATRLKSAEALAPELDAIATAAADRLRAEVAGNDQDARAAQSAVVDAASAALAAGQALGDIAAAEQAGQTSAREELGKDLLRAVERASRRKRDAESEYEQAITRAATLGLAHREIATAAQVAHGTIRSILTRSPASTNDTQPPAEQDNHDGHQQHTTP